MCVRCVQHSDSPPSPPPALQPIYGFSAVLMPLAMFVRAHKRDTPLCSGAGAGEDGSSPTSPHAALLAHLTYNNLPIVMTVAQFLCYCIGPLKVFSKDWPFTAVSLLFSWSYCRFYYNFHENGSSNGNADAAEGAVAPSLQAAGAGGDSYAFVAMFPKSLHVVMVPLSTAFYNIVALTGLFPALGTACVLRVPC